MKPEKFKVTDLTLTPTAAVVQCWECKKEFPVFSEFRGSRSYFVRGRSAWVWHQSRRECPLCGGELWKYDSADALTSSKARTQARQLVEQSEADKLHELNAGLSLRLKDALTQVALLLAELRRSEADRALLKAMMDDLRQQVIAAPPKPSCAHCHTAFEHPATGRKARFCSPLCRLHSHRETKQKTNVSNQEVKQ